MYAKVLCRNCVFRAYVATAILRPVAGAQMEKPMSRIPTVDLEALSQEQQALLGAVEAQLGMTPNFLKVFAHSPAALRAFLGLYAIAGEGSLDPLTRERIALALAQQNACEYCLSAHTALGRGAGLGDDEIASNRSGSSQEPRAAAAVRFARALADSMGDVSASDLLAIREAGYTDGEIVEIITHVGLNLLTNILGRASHVEIDFPKVTLERAA